ncbi:MAG: hypothetical protein R3D85_06005 [Paracoccaceae bacterium]
MASIWWLRREASWTDQVGNIGSVAGLIGEIARHARAVAEDRGDQHQPGRAGSGDADQYRDGAGKVAATVSLADSAQTLAQEMAQFETGPSAPPLASAGAGRAMRRIA